MLARGCSEARLLRAGPLPEIIRRWRRNLFGRSAQTELAAGLPADPARGIALLARRIRAWSTGCTPALGGEPALSEGFG